MAKRSILQKNNHKLSAPNDIDNQIINYLRSMKNKSATQAKIASSLGVDASTISRHIKKLIGERFDYGSFYYHIERVENQYHLIKTLKHTDAEKSKEESNASEERESYRINDLAEKGVCSSESAEIIPFVIFYGIKKKYISDVIDALNSNFNPDIFLDLIPVESGIYIMLKKQNNQDKLENYKNQLSKFYTDIVEQIKLYNPTYITKNRGKKPI